MARRVSSASPEARFSIIGVLDDELPLDTVIETGVRVLGRAADLKDIARNTEAKSVIITSSKIDQQGLLAQPIRGIRTAFDTSALSARDLSSNWWRELENTSH